MTRITPERIHSFNAFEVVSAAVATPSMFITSDIALFALRLVCVARAIPPPGSTVRPSCSLPA